MIPFTRTKLHVDRGHDDVGAGEIFRIVVDVSPILRADQRIVSATAVLLDRATNADLSNGRIVDVAATDYQVAATIQALTANTQYRVIFKLVPQTGIVREQIWDLDCVA